jgi:transcriptional regulator of acetoin/glycerol metabolism
MCHGEVIEAEHLPIKILTESATSNGIALNTQSEKDIILETLRRHRGNKSRAAQELGIHRSTLWRKIKTYGISSY